MIDQKRKIIQRVFIVIGCIFLLKLFFIQILDRGYKLAAENNIIQKEVSYPYRGLIYDRNEKLIIYNAPIYDLLVVPNKVRIKDTIALCSLLNISKSSFIERLDKAKGYSYVKPSLFIKQISNHEFASIQSKLIENPGFYIDAKTVRAYPHKSLANALGYIGEISKKGLERDTANYYKAGDHIGISGLEAKYERALRGKRGVKFKMVNVRGVEKGAFKNGEFDTLPIPGKNLITTIDLDLQQYGESLFKNKVGSIVAIEPSSGEILTLISSPSYDPSLLSGKDFGQNYLSLQNDSLVPLFNRPIMAMYPPGSIFKIIQALIAMQEGVLASHTTYACNKALVNCHDHQSPVNLYGAIKHSCNPYFYINFRNIINQNKDDNTYVDSQLGLDVWNTYVSNFGLGKRLGIDLPNEKPGNIPTSAYYDRLYGKKRWKFSTIYSLSIGQGEMLITPLQMANLAAIIANKGFFYTPHLVKAVKDIDTVTSKDTLIHHMIKSHHIKHDTGIKAKYFPIVIDAMEEALEGTAPRAIMKDIVICGKTGTAQNPHGEDHSVFMAFAPKENPQIAIAVYVENAGWGGRAAASTASLLIEKYLTDTITRPQLEKYVLEGNFGD